MLIIGNFTADQSEWVKIYVAKCIFISFVETVYLYIFVVNN